MSGQFAYIRVSTREQNEDRQRKAMEELGITGDHLFTDKESGRNFNRTNYIRLKDTLGKGDTLFVKSIDRLGRNYSEILEEWRILTKVKEVDIVVLDMPLLDTRVGRDLTGTFIADLVLQILSYVSENEYRNIKQRQKEGIEAAKARGVKFGRPEKSVPCMFDDAVLQWRAGELSIAKAARMVDMPLSTFYRKAKISKTCTFREMDKVWLFRKFVGQVV